MTNFEETSSEVGRPNLFLWRPARNKQISMKLSFDGQSACSLIFRICTNYPSCWSDICRQKFIVQESMFTSPNGKLLGSNKRRKRTIKADNLHALFVHIWILVCYQLPFGPHLQWRLENSFRNILEHSSYISSPQHFLRVQYLQKTYHEQWSCKRLNFSLSKLMLWRSISGRKFTNFKE